ncbi:molybdopterin-dependent oxidoreductase [Leptolyngbyaceae cyanobacterium UHCC 1019]
MEAGVSAHYPAEEFNIVKRRHLLKRVLQGSGGMIGASLLASCGERALDRLFSLDLANPAERLPDHLITSLSEFYVQSYALPANVDTERWRLQIMGAVEMPLNFSYGDIVAAPQEFFHLTMECIGNPTGGNLIGNAEWTGTPLLPFLQQAGVKPEAVVFVLHGADYYETTLPVAEVMRSQVQLVYQMNRAPLTKEHGYPVRLIVPGYFGQKQPKWLTKIEAIAKSKKGYWERQGWSNTAEIPIHALIQQVEESRVWNQRSQVTIPKNGETGWKNGILIAGVAIDHANPIQQIQISTDEGKTWQTAEQNQPASPHEWTLWRYGWQPTQPGRYTLLARARTKEATQPLDDTNSKDGSSGALRIQVDLAQQT